MPMPPPSRTAVCFATMILFVLSACTNPHTRGHSDDRILPGGHKREGVIGSVKEMGPDRISLELVPDNGRSVDVIVSKNDGGALFSNIDVLDQFADSESGVGYIIVDRKRRVLEFVWITVVLNEDFLERGPDYLEIAGSHRGEDLKYIYRYGGFRPSPLTGTYVIGTVVLPEWLYAGKFRLR